MTLEEIFFIIGDIFLIVGVVFFVVGTVAVFRFNDLYTRLHGLAKIDNLGLGFITIGMIFHIDSFFTSMTLIFIWLLVLLSSSTLSFILSSHSNKTGEKPLLGDLCDTH
ncbi:MAG: monovalent cation/H(+) antiporter subunit G [Campylobacterales bacterium]